MRILKRIVVAGWTILAVFIIAAMTFPSVIMGMKHLWLVVPFMVVLLLLSAVYKIWNLYRNGMRRP